MISAAFLLSGCTAMGTASAGGSPQSTTPLDGNQDTEQSDQLGLKFGEPNDSFTEALPTLVNGDRAELQGTVSRAGDVDVFNLGPMEAGDRLVVDLDTAGSPLDSAIAVYDDQGRLFMDNDDRSGNDLDSYIDEVVRHDGDPYYLAVTHSAFPDQSEYQTGGYWVTVRITRNGSVPAPKSQTLFLDFDGGTIDVPAIIEFNAHGETVMPFSAESISSVYSGSTETIKAFIIDTMVENFDGFAVELITSDQGTPTVDEYSTVFFGSKSNDEFPVFGISESVDHYNDDPSDIAVIFTESFTPQAFGFAPRPRELGMAIGNVAAHEAGHILGLNHVDDDEDLMDTLSPNVVLLDDQDFAESPVSDQILDLGTQDALLLLAEILGIS